MLRIFKNLSIRLKIIVVVMFSVFTALFVAGTIIILLEQYEFKDKTIEEGRILSEIVSNSVAAALVFDDKANASETIATLEPNRRIEYILIFDLQGNHFASYLNSDFGDLPTVPSFGLEDYIFTDDVLLTKNNIVLDGEKIGTTIVGLDLEQMRANMREDMLVLALVSILAAGIALLIMGRLQRLISEPILHLSGVAEKISRDGDYSLRVTPFGSDEIGFLYVTFNEMLAHIQESDQALKHAHDKLEERVEERTRELQIEIAERKRADREKADRLKRSKRQHYALMRIVRDPSISEGKIQNSFELITKLSTEALATFRTSIWLFDNKRKVLQCQGSYDNEKDHYTTGALLKTDDYPILIESLNSDRAIDASDFENDPRTMELYDSFKNTQNVTSALLAAIRAAGNILGMVLVEHKGPMRQWAFDEIVFCGELADQIAHLVVARERRQAEILSKSLQEKLEKAERMEALGVLAGGVAHDLNNMIGPLVGYPELILRKLPDDSPIR